MSSSESEISMTSESDKQLQFVHIVKQYPVLFNKSQLPKVKDEKSKCLSQAISTFKNTFGKTISVQQMKKKIHNMKSEIKRKTDKHATGNKKIKLKVWEKEMMEVMSADINPVFTQVPGAMSAGIYKAQSSTSTSNPPPSTSSSTSEVMPCIRPPSCKKSKEKLPETEETVNMSTSELQRLLILEQLKLTRIQMEKETLIIET